MDIKKLGDNITEFDGKVRIEKGPATLVANATEELLSNDVTAGHYAVGKPDAVNKIIELDKPMTYIDWRRNGPEVYYVYRLEQVEVIGDKGAKKMIDRWVEKGIYPDEATAMSQATTLL